MIRVANIKLSPVKKESVKDLSHRLIEYSKSKYRLSDADIKEFFIVKKSIDARKKDEIFVICTIDLCLNEKKENELIKRHKEISKISIKTYNPIIKNAKIKNRPLVVGMGPAGLFCAYILALNGLNPVVIDRGKSVFERKQDVDAFWNENALNLNSNVQFGEGGAGTFSDGKLNTQIKDKTGRIDFVLNTFVKSGATDDIVFESKPHIGTDVLMEVVKNLRNEIIDLGGEFLYSTTLVDLLIENDRIKGAIINDVSGKKTIETDNIILCIGHSSRDTFRMLKKLNVNMSPKKFALGYRVQHLQKDINLAQYGDLYCDYFKAAPYKLTYTTKDGRGVFSFCNCPGGYVVNASSENERLAINGMSYHDRGSDNANSAIIMQVGPDDYNEDINDPLCGVYFQEKLEEKAYKLCNGAIPIQKFGDYEKNIKTKDFGNVTNSMKGNSSFTNLRGLLSPSIEAAFIEGMHDFGKKIKGFCDEDILVAALESRTSSPVRIERNEDFLSNIYGLYPCGEGAGYAGGITSAAVDGIKVAEAVIRNNE